MSQEDVSNYVAQGLLEELSLENLYRFQQWVPLNILRLLALEKKSKVISLSKTLVITEEEFSRLVLFYGTANYQYRFLSREYRPPGTDLTPEEHASLSQRPENQNKAEFSKAIRKFKRVFEERKFRYAHLFRVGPKWHAFYFTYEDRADGRPGHGNLGPHLHFVNYLWPEYKLENMESALFDERHTRVDGVHIRFEPRQREEPEDDSLGIP